MPIAPNLARRRLEKGELALGFGVHHLRTPAVGMIAGFVYLGTALQSVSLGFLTTQSWSYWPLFMLPFSFIGLFLLTRIWRAVPKGSGGH